MLKSTVMPVHTALPQAVKRGFYGHCPHCGIGNLFGRYLKPSTSCWHCGERLDEYRTDDIAPYFTMLVIGHLVVPLILLAEQLFAPPLWFHGSIWPPLTMLAALLALPRIKGAVLGWMWWLGLRGDEQH